MTKRKPANEPDQNAGNPAQLPEQGADIQQPGSADSADVGLTSSIEPGKSKWVAQFNNWSDYEAGVKLIEDRENRRLTIKFDEKPSEAVRTLMKDPEHGYRFDPDDQVWYKKLNPAKPVQSRREAEELAFEVANLIREEKSLEAKKSFAMSM